MVKWRALVVDDRQGDDVKQLLESSRAVGPDDEIEALVVTNFDEAISQIHRQECDFIVLDLKDDTGTLPDEESLRGKDVFDAIKRSKFAPVIFYTAFPNRVDVPETAFVKIVERSDVDRLEAALKEIFGTRMMQLSRGLDEQKRSFMWDFVDTEWKKIEVDENYREELAHMLARRIASGLRMETIKSLAAKEELDALAHPAEVYIYPPIESAILQMGDIVECGGVYHIVLTPTCDFVPRPNKGNKCNADYALLAKCVEAKHSDIGQKVREELKSKGIEELSKNTLTMVTDFVLSKDTRYYFLPAVLDGLPHLVVDLQQLSVAETHVASSCTRVATLDSPYAEHVTQRFSHYVGRVGTPDLDRNLLLDRLFTSLKAVAS
jgi:hypothetical protein